ncbi:hypothetical protein RFI_38417, partial [Reticulomyxa filosa]
MYYKVNGMQKHIDELNVICYNQFKKDLKTIGGNEEEQIYRDIITTCDFKGKIKDMHGHLNNLCTLKESTCWFEQFGCKYFSERDLEQHLIENMKQHFEL